MLHLARQQKSKHLGLLLDLISSESSAKKALFDQSCRGEHFTLGARYQRGSCRRVNNGQTTEIEMKLRRFWFTLNYCLQYKLVKLTNVIINCVTGSWNRSKMFARPRVSSSRASRANSSRGTLWRGSVTAATRAGSLDRRNVSADRECLFLSSQREKSVNLIRISLSPTAALTPEWEDLRSGCWRLFPFNGFWRAHDYNDFDFAFS